MDKWWFFRKSCIFVRWIEYSFNLTIEDVIVDELVCKQAYLRENVSGSFCYIGRDISNIHQDVLVFLQILTTH